MLIPRTDGDAPSDVGARSRVRRHLLGTGWLTATVLLVPIVLSGAVSAPAAASAASMPERTVRIAPGAQPLRMSAIRPGTRRYVRYTIEADGRRKLIDLWQRTVSREPAGDGGPGVIRIVQRWDRVDGTTLEQDSTFDAATFAPRTHTRREVKAEGVKLGAYRFLPDRVVGLPEIAGNLRAGFSMPLTEPVFNFEHDMELLEALPLRAGVAFSIPFYDAGIDPKPDRYVFRVAGDESIVGWDGRRVDCWLVTADYGTATVLTRFWISKAGHVLVRELQTASGVTLVKALLPDEGEARP